MTSTCQRCGGERNDCWNVNQAEFNVGTVKNWKVQLCVKCTTAVEQALLNALRQNSARGEAPDA